MSSASDLNRQGVLAKQRHDIAAAENLYRRAIAAAPDLAEAHFNLGILKQDLGRIREAITCWEQARALRPDVEVIRGRLGQAYTQLGNGCRERSDLAGAAEHYRKAAQYSVEAAAPLINLSQIHRIRGEFETALLLAQRAVGCEPSLWEAHLNLGNLYSELGRLDEAIASYQAAVRADPSRSEAYLYLGDTWVRCGCADTAGDQYQLAIEAEPTSPRPLKALGDLHCRSGEFAEAATFYELASDLDPKDPIAKLRAATTCPLVFASTTQMDGLRQRALAVARDCQDARLATPPTHLAPTFAPAPFFLQFLDGNLRELKTAIAGVYRNYFTSEPARSLIGEPGSRSAKSSNSRVGFVVTRSHERGFLCSMAHVVSHLSQVGFDVSVSCGEAAAGQLRRAFPSEAVQVVPLPERFDLAARRLANQQFDLLYFWEVGTDPTNYFLPFLRIAPVQCSSWGVQVTSGIANLDVYLSSREMETAVSSAHYSEQLVLADPLLIKPQTPLHPAACGREDFGLDSSMNLYACLQNLGKIHPEMDEPLAAILRRDPCGRVLFVSDAGGKAKAALQLRLEQTIPDVASRCVFLEPLSRERYLAVLGFSDVSLDPIHFSGMNTTFDALALGKPMVTRPTEQQRSRFASACLRRLGLAELVVDSLADYTEQALTIAGDKARQRGIAASIDSGIRELLDPREACEAHEQLFHELLARFR